MTTIVTRAGKGSALTWAEGDANFTNLNTAKYESGDYPEFAGAVIGSFSPAATGDEWATVEVGREGNGILGYTLGYSVLVTGNAYYDNTNWRFANTGIAWSFGVGDDNFSVRRTASGTAGTVITWTNLLAVELGKSLALQGATSVTGAGISFPAVQVPSTDANTLDDYEENTWAPGVSFGGGTTGIIYGAQTGSYVKIGKLVTCHGRITLTNKGSSTGNMLITGLPFTTDSTIRCAGVVGYYDQTASLVDGMFLYTNVNATTIAVLTGGATTTPQMTHANVNNTFDVIFSITYTASA